MTRSDLVGPGAICRLDDRLLERIARGERLAGVAISAVATIVVGAGLYGLAFGIWRALEQAFYSALKLPALLLSVAACTLGLSAMLAATLRSRLLVQTTAVAILLSLAVASAALGAMAPVSIVVALVAPPPDPAALGLPIADPRVAASLAVAREQLLLHVGVIAVAGVVGVVRLRGLLARLGLTPVVLRRVLVSFLSIQFLVGVELSWLFRPFFGRPHLPPTFSCDDLLEGNFFEELTLALRPAFGGAAPAALAIGVGLLAVVALGAISIGPEAITANVEVGPSGLALGGPGQLRVVAWAGVASVWSVGPHVHIALSPDPTLTVDVLRIACEGAAQARELAARIDAARSTRPSGAFRTAHP